MAASYKTQPTASGDLPSGIPYIVGNEAAERFSYYGMRSILVVFMTRYLVDAGGAPDYMDDAEARFYYHLFAGSVYFFPLVGALVADLWLGKYRTIVGLSLVYCAGHGVLAYDDTRFGLSLGLFLIALGSGGIKPCVSAHVGDQFGIASSHWLTRVFGWFYVAINVGAFASSLLTPWLLDRFGAHVAFGVPGALMLAATWVFWLGRTEFVHIPPGGRSFLREVRGRETIRVLAKLATLYVFVAVFWSLYDQTGAAWVLQAQSMNRHLFGVEWRAAQVQAINPVLILVFVPLFSRVLYPALEGLWRLTSLRKIGLGLALAGVSFLVPAQVELWIDAGATPSIAWHLLAYVIITAAEVLVSVTCLEFSYTQAPRTMKSLVMAFYLLTISLGNVFTSLVNFWIGQGEGARLSGASYYLFFAAVMAAATVGFAVVTRGYTELSIMQPDGETGDESGGVATSGDRSQ
jgi:POT family proton-dependent oligopeptide transporter